MWRIWLTLALTTCWAYPTTAQQDGIEIGVLTCTFGESGDADGSARQSRDASCTLQPKSGPEETYAGKAQGISVSAQHEGVLIWVVRSTSGRVMEAGILEQEYAIDPRKPAAQKPPMFGETNSDIALHPMADPSEGSAGAPQKRPPSGFVVLSLELKLKSTMS